jgi:hypothetical protein
MASAALALTAGAASAQSWMSINDRQRMLDDRIDAGVRTGELSRQEAVRLRSEFRDIARMEAAYRRDGLTASERRVLDERFDRLAMRVRLERNDWERRDTARNDDWRRWFGGNDWRDDRGRWVSIDRRQAQLDRRIDQGIRSGQLTASEAARLRSDFSAIARIEMRYRRNGLSASEMADLDRRFDMLADKIRFERSDRDRRYGYNNTYRR